MDVGRLVAEMEGGVPTPVNTSTSTNGPPSSSKPKGGGKKIDGLLNRQSLILETRDITVPSSLPMPCKLQRELSATFVLPQGDGLLINFARSSISMTIQMVDQAGKALEKPVRATCIMEPGWVVVWYDNPSYRHDGNHHL